MKGGWRLETTNTIVSLILIYRDPPTNGGVCLYWRLSRPRIGNRPMRSYYILMLGDWQELLFGPIIMMGAGMRVGIDILNFGHVDLGIQLRG